MRVQTMTDKEHTLANNAEAQGEVSFALVTRRVNSFDARNCALVFAVLAGISLVIAVVFAALGAWLILPFAGLEAFALYLAYDWLVRHAGDSESLEIRGDVVTLAVRDAHDTRQHEFNRVWAQLVESRQSRWGQDMRLALRSHGREVEVGRYLDDSARAALAQELKARLRGF